MTGEMYDFETVSGVYVDHYVDCTKLPERDRRLIAEARALPAIHWGRIGELMELAETEDAKAVLWEIEGRLYREEERYGELD